MIRLDEEDLQEIRLLLNRLGEAAKQYQTVLREMQRSLHTQDLRTAVTIAGPISEGAAMFTAAATALTEAVTGRGYVNLSRLRAAYPGLSAPIHECRRAVFSAQCQIDMLRDLVDNRNGWQEQAAALLDVTSGKLLDRNL